MDNDKSKKDSIFSSVFPQPDPVQPPVQAVAPVPRPAVPDEQVSALNRKIEMMERSIVGEIEKRLATVPQPAPPIPQPVPSVPPVLLEKMTEMETRFREFQEKFLLGAAQMKNIEESKISARREIEELLKVVREQQKYSELDRQMHAQLEKAWSRVEEMEKRLVEAYGAASRRNEETVPAGALAAEVCAQVESRLEARLRPLEAVFNGLAEKLADLPAAGAQTERRVEFMASAVEAEIRGFSGAVEKISSGVAAGRQFQEDALQKIKAEIRAAVFAGLEDGNSMLVRHVDASSLDRKEQVDSLARLLVGHTDSIGLEQRKGAAQLQELEKVVLARVADITEELRSENEKQLSRVREASGLSMAALAQMTSASGVLGEAIENVSLAAAAIKKLVKDMEPLNLEALLGVSGAMLRRSFEVLPALAEELDKYADSVAKRRVELDASLEKIRKTP